MTQRIINANALDVLRSMSDESIGLCVTDPPYEVITGGAQVHKRGDQPRGILKPDSGTSFTGANLHNGICHPEEYMPDLFRVMEDPSHVYIMTNFLNLERTLTAMRTAGFKIHNLLVWKKNNAIPNRWYMKNCEFIIMGRKGPAFTINEPGSKMVMDFNSVKNRTHPVEKPKALWYRLIQNSHQYSRKILDPFCGTGSSGLAAKAYHADYIGVELDPKYAAIAAQRLGVLPSCLNH